MKENTRLNHLTEGPIFKQIIAFAVPLLWGNIFQQLYNVADSLIVGNFLGNTALAAVSSSGQLIFLMVGFFNGIGIGAGAVTARYFGAREYDHLRKAIHTTLAFGLICGAAVTCISLIAAPYILVLIGVPAEVMNDSLTYFRIYFMGSIAFIMYNFQMGILQSLGDSRHPLYFLIASSLLNVFLDLLFIGGFHMGVGSAAFATILSQFLSAGLCYRQLTHNPENTRVRTREIRLERTYLKQIMLNGIPTGIQNSVISIANVFVQSNINVFGAVAMAGCGCYSKIEGFAFVPIICFSQALTTFVSQNLGAKQYARAKKGAVYGVVSVMLLAELIGLAVYLSAPLLLGAFSQNQDIITCGVKQAHVIALFYCFLACSHGMAAIQRGAGRSLVPMLVMFFFWCFFRVIYITVITGIIPKIEVIFWAYPLTWVLSTTAFLIIFLKTDWLHGFEKQHRLS